MNLRLPIAIALAATLCFAAPALTQAPASLLEDRVAALESRIGELQAANAALATEIQVLKVRDQLHDTRFGLVEYDVRELRAKLFGDVLPALRRVDITLAGHAFSIDALTNGLERLRRQVVRHLISGSRAR